MEKRELNKQIKNLLKIKDRQKLEEEFNRLYYVDRPMEYMNKESIKIMIRMNLKYRIIPIHLFGIHIDYNDSVRF